jgi:hypothetical protein
MHYRTERIDWLEPVDEFLERAERVERLTSSTFEPDALPRATRRSSSCRRPPRYDPAELSNVNCGWVGVGAKRPASCGDECHLKPGMDPRGDIRRLAAARSRLLPSRR